MAFAFMQKVRSTKSNQKGIVVGEKKDRIKVRMSDGSVKLWRADRLQAR